MGRLRGRREGGEERSIESGARGGRACASERGVREWEERKRERGRERELSLSSVSLPLFLSIATVSVRDGKASQERGARKKRRKWVTYAQEHLLLTPIPKNKLRPLLK